MHKLKLKTDGSVIAAIKQSILVIALLFIILPIFIFWDGVTAIPELNEILYNMLIVGIFLLLNYSILIFLLSRYSPVKILKIRKQIINFTRLFLKSETDGLLIHSVKWMYGIKGRKTIIDLYFNGLVKDSVEIGQKLSEYLGLPMLKYEESDGKARYIFANPPKRYDGIMLIGKGIPNEYKGDYKPDVSYEPIPIYDNIIWNYNSEALHILLIAPSGAGKSQFLRYLGGMVLRRQHMLHVIDAKNSDLGRLFRHIGVGVAVETDEIIKMLTKIVDEMNERYSKYFAADNADIDANFTSLGLKGQILIFDEVLAALGEADKKQKAEIERLLGQLALKGRAVGISLVITAQKLNATDLPKSITEQCQTRIILGAVVSDETFHQATGYYKKDIAGAYKGGVGKGYAITPKSDGLAYIETPQMPEKTSDYIMLFKELRDRGTPYGEGR